MTTPIGPEDPHGSYQLDRPRPATETTYETRYAVDGGLPHSQQWADRGDALSFAAVARLIPGVTQLALYTVTKQRVDLFAILDGAARTGPACHGTVAGIEADCGSGDAHGSHP